MFMTGHGNDKPEGKRPLQDLDIDGNTILKRFLQEYGEGLD
jgi:hypothetical protein